MWDKIIAFLKKLFELGAKVTKIDLVWGRAECINGVLAFNWMKKSDAEWDEFCEFSAANGYTAVGVELGGEATWWPKDRMSFKTADEVRLYLRGAVKKLKNKIGSVRKRGLKLQIYGINSNADFCRLIRNAATLMDANNYLVEELGTDNILFLPINENDDDLFKDRAAMCAQVIAHAESLFDKKQTVAYGKRRSDAAFIETHPSRPGVFKGSSWSDLIVGDNGDHLSAIKSDGVTGQTPRELQYEAAYGKYIDAGCSTCTFDFWTDWKKWKPLMAKIGKRFEAKHGKR